MKQLHKKCTIVLICLLMFGNFTHGIVLCFGSDGHISLELLHTDNCDDFPATPVDPQQNLCPDINYSANTDSCGDCIDIVLPGSCESKRLTSFVTKDSSHLNTLPKTFFSVFTDNNTSTDKICIVKPGDPVGDILTSISTIVLIV